MASVTSIGTSPRSRYEAHLTDTPSEADDSLWQLLDLPGSSVPSTGLDLSPASASLRSWTKVGPRGCRLEPSPTTSSLSPLSLDLDHTAHLATSTYGDTAARAFAAMPSPAGGNFTDYFFDYGEQQFLATGEQPLGEHVFDTNMDLSAFLDQFGPLEPAEQLQLGDGLIPRLIPHQLQSGPNAPPWNPTDLNTAAGDSPIFVMGDSSFKYPSPQQQHRSSAASPSVSGGSQSPAAVGAGAGTTANRKRLAATPPTAPIAIRRVRAGARVGKKKPTAPISAARSCRSSSCSSGAGLNQFLIVTPDSVNAHNGRPNPYDCFEAARPSQKGRKGPLAVDTKENALQVRRLGACFSCHARKVRCDKERPCRHCQKLMLQVPQVICWQFQDFIPVLFPTFIRAHFRKEEMARFISENIDSFTVNGQEELCLVGLSSGARFASTLQLKAKFFTAKTLEVLQHWHTHAGPSGAGLQARATAPIGLDMDDGLQREELRKKIKHYIHSIIQEPTYAEQVTDTLRHTELPRRILRIVQQYSAHCDSLIVKKALSIYAMHYVMTRHLYFTRQSIINLQSSGLIPQDAPWVTPRVLNRQVKSVIDELLMRETQLLFESFSKSLKPKSRREWAPCLAAFLVLCLFMEEVESAAETFVVSQNEVDRRNHARPAWERSFALDVNREVENLPFKQFAYQFHQVYQTHSRDATAKSFNPLTDVACAEQVVKDQGVTEMVSGLRQLIYDPEHAAELDFLCADPVLLDMQGHPACHLHNISHNYSGRLVAKFLLSFTNEKYIFGPTSSERSTTAT